MKCKRLSAVAALVALAGISGCTTVNRDVTSSAYDYATSIGEDYLDYVDADPALSVGQKQLRHDRQDEHVNMLETALGINGDSTNE